MAYWDETQQMIILRVVYDGAGTSGKTANVRALHDQLVMNRPRELPDVEIARGRTEYFDWLELNAGNALGFRVRCQVLSVPGQFGYAPRRWEILRDADVVVFVCDSTPGALKRSRLSRTFLKRALEAHGHAKIPIVYQANKQDLPTAIAPAALATSLRLPKDAEILGASAIHEQGVLRTFLRAVHRATENVIKQLKRGGVESLPKGNERPSELLLRIQNFEGSPEADRALEAVDNIITDDDSLE